MLVLIIRDFENDFFCKNDKLLVHNYYNDVFVTGSFCTYDGYDLKDSVLIGNKLICCKCGSSYCIESGTVENGPAIRNISAFPIDIDKKDGTVYAFLPDSKIPPYGKQKIVPQAKLNLENYVIIGDTLTTLGAIVALRSTYDSKIQIIPDGFKKNGFINTKFLIESLQPKDIEDQYIVDSDFLEKNYCEYFPEKTTQDIMQIDNHKKKILFRDGTELEYTKCLIACGSRKENTFDNYENAFTLNSVYDHAKIYNHIKTAKTIVIYGNTFETYELASSARQLANSFGNTNSIVYLIEPPPGEVFRSFGENVHKSIKAMLFVNKINVLTDYLIVDQKSDINGLIESGLGKPYLQLNNYIEDPKKYPPEMVNGELFCVDYLSSVDYKNLYSTIFAAGMCTMVNSLYKDGNYRYFGPFNEVDSGFYAGMAMQNKRIGFKDIPMTTFSIMGNFYAYIGERDPIYTEIIVEGNLAKMQYIVYLYNLEKQKSSKGKDTDKQIVGILVCNIPKVHIIMREAMRLGNVIPSYSKFIRNGKQKVSFRDICEMTIKKLNKNMECKRDMFLE